MMHQPHPAELEAAWAARQGHPVGPDAMARAQQAEMYVMSLGHAAGPVPHGAAGPPPPPQALTPGFAPDANGQVTASTAPRIVAGSSSSSRGAGGTDNGFVAGGEGRGGAADAEGVVAVAGSGNEVDEGGREVGASARALAAEMASDPDGRFRDSELLRFAGRLGTGGLRVSGDKVLFQPLPLVARARG